MLLLVKCFLVINLCAVNYCDLVTLQKPAIHLQVPIFRKFPTGYSYNPPTKPPEEGYPPLVQFPPSSNPPFFDEIPSSGYFYPTPNQSKNLYLYGPPIESPTTKEPPFNDEPLYLPPPQEDVPQEPIPSYGPPAFPTTIQPPLNDVPEIPPTIPDGSYLPPEIDEVPPGNQYLPPNDDTNDAIVIEVPDSIYLPPNKVRTPKSNRLQIRVYNMSCIKTPTRSYFKTVIQTSRALQNIPVIENIQTKNCISLVPSHPKNEFHLVMNGIDQMEKCGIVDCSTKKDKIELCTNIRLPTIVGLKLPEDIMLTLQCRTQEKYASQVKYISMHPQEIQGRSVQSATVVGGKQSELNGNAILLRRSPNNKEFIITVQKGSSVLLGEELLLKTHIRNNDGWRYSRITDVKMYQIDTPNTKNPQPKHLIEILNHEGCRNIHLQGIVPNDQTQDTNDPLISTLPLRAFAFQGMKSGQQMILTAKIKGCVEANDCESRCSDYKNKHHRKRRNTSVPKNVPKNSTKTEDFESEFKFRILMPIEGGPPQITYTYERKINDDNWLIRWLPTIITGFLIFVPILAVILLMIEK